MSGQLSLFDRLGALSTYQPRVETDHTRAQAAVAILCARSPDSILLIKRSLRPDDPWSGQMGLPGGRKGAEDPDLLATAIRETREEVGVTLHPRQMVGALDDLAPITVHLPRITVRPFVFLLHQREPLVPNPEVAGSWWVELPELTGPGVFGEYQVQARDLVMTRPGYRLPHGIVWGMTERILTPFLGILGGGREGTVL